LLTSEPRREGRVGSTPGTPRAENTPMTRTFITIIAIAITGPAMAQPLPHVKSGQCSGGYVQSGSWQSRPLGVLAADARHPAYGGYIACPGSGEVGIGAA
jgi:hypothetical protein